MPARIIGVVLLLAVGVAGARGQDALRIAAIVNDEVISLFDIESRLSLIVFSSGLADRPETRRRLLPQVLQELVDDKLKLQEARRLEVSVDPAAIDRALTDIEQRNNLPPGGLDQFLDQAGLTKTVLVDQIEAQLAWVQVIRRTQMPRIQVSDEEVEEGIAKIRAAAGKPELRLFEIFMPVESAEEDGRVKALVERLVQDLRAGGNFRAVARNFSKGSTAASGGDLGWVKQGELARELDQAAFSLGAGAVSDPIRTLAGYHILRLEDRRISPGLSGGADVKVTLHQVFLPVDPRLPADRAQAVIAEARTATATARSCEDMNAVGARISPDLSGSLGTVKLTALPPALRGVVEALPPNMPSAPQRTEAGVVVLMVCDRIEPASEDNERTRIRRNLENERLEDAARRYLRDLRRSAFVDVRI